MTKKINDKDKLIIALYINGCGLSDALTVQLCMKISEQLAHSFDDTVKFICLPIKDADKPKYEFECINCKFFNDAEYLEFMKRLESLEKKFEDCGK